MGCFTVVAVAAMEATPMSATLSAKRLAERARRVALATSRYVIATRAERTHHQMHLDLLGRLVAVGEFLF